MDTKTIRAAELLFALRTAGWTNEQFWEAHVLLTSTSSREMSETLINLLFAWGDVESDRIACGEHDGCSDEMAARIAAKWPVKTLH